MNAIHVLIIVVSLAIAAYGAYETVCARQASEAEAQYKERKK